MSNNLELWKKVEKTNPKYTKQANVKGNKITAIAPQYQIMNVTEQFGSYGSTWGFKDISFDYSLVSAVGLVVFKAIFFYPKGEFPIMNSISLYMDNARTKVDDNFAKKVETDALTKAVSKLGFNADIFLGKFDDQRYLEDTKQEFQAEEQKKNAEEQQRQIERYKAETILKIESTKTEDELKKVWLSIPKDWQSEFLSTKDKQKELIINK